MSRNALTRRSFGRFCLAGASLAAWPAGAQAQTFPQRIAVIDYGLAEALMLIGITPIAVMSAADWKIWVVEPALPPGVADLGASVEPNFERLAALQPDLILTTNYVAMAEPTLRRIAPVRQLTIHGGADGYAPLARSAEVTRELGRLTGREAEAEKAIAEFDAEIAALGASCAPGTQGPCFSCPFWSRDMCAFTARPAFTATRWQSSASPMPGRARSTAGASRRSASRSW